MREQKQMVQTGIRLTARRPELGDSGLFSAMAGVMRDDVARVHSRREIDAHLDALDRDHAAGLHKGVNENGVCAECGRPA